MSASNPFPGAFQAHQQSRADLQPAGLAHLHIPGSVITDDLNAFLANPPQGSLLLGLAEDGRPVLLDLYDPKPGPLLVAGDAGSGKTALLQSLARASGLLDPGDVQFGVVTAFPQEWSAFEVLPHSLGIWPSFHPSAQDFLSKLVGWAESLPKTHQAILLFLDGLDLLSGRDDSFEHMLRWLLLYGPEHQVWPVLTANPARHIHWQSWFEYFHTHLVGRVKHTHHARLLVGDSPVNPAGLLAGTQFILSGSSPLQKFWLPPWQEA